MSKILFLHGFFASGQCVPALLGNPHFRMTAFCKIYGNRGVRAYFPRNFVSR